jgi:tetratricopeptide (TPR) repeat protein
MSDYEDAVMDGIASLNRGKYERSMASFEKAIQLDPNQATGYLGRANALNSLKRWEESLPDYNRALEIDATLANAYVNRGIAYAHLDKPRRAIADYEKALELDPKIDNPPTFIKRLFSNEPNTDKGIRKHLEALKKQVESG